MNKKHLRKELELSLVKAIEDLLISKNPEAAKQVDEIIFGASRIIAKKFYKSIKHKEEKKVEAKKVAPKKKAAKAAPKSSPEKVAKAGTAKAKSKK
jgi:predicted transposase YdaD